MVPRFCIDAEGGMRGVLRGSDGNRRNYTNMYPAPVRQQAPALGAPVAVAVGPGSGFEGVVPHGCQVLHCCIAAMRNAAPWWIT